MTEAPEPATQEAIGDRYQRETKYHRGRLSGGLDWSRKPETFKTYRDCAVTIPLPAPPMPGQKALWQVLQERRSVRDFSDHPLTLAELSQLLWATQGVSASMGGYLLRTAPSAGALYPIETYLVANNVGDLEAGLYHYYVPEPRLEQLRAGDLRMEVARTALDQPMAAEAAVVFIWTAVVQRSKWKYKQRGYRYIYLDAGHIGENLHLAAVALGLGCCAIGALYDEEVNALLGVDGEEETVVYLSVVGRP